MEQTFEGLHGTDVGKQSQFLAHSQQALLGTHFGPSIRATRKSSISTAPTTRATVAPANPPTTSGVEIASDNVYSIFRKTNEMKSDLAWKREWEAKVREKSRQEQARQEQRERQPKRKKRSYDMSL